MDAGLKLSLPLLRVTMRWQTWLIMLMAVALALVTDSNDIGLGASGGAAAMLVISAALGLTLRRCRSRGLARTLPGFTRTALFAVTAVLGVLVLILGSMDGWRPESLLAITVAASVGLGVGLSLPVSWLQWAYIGAILWIIWGNNDLAALWTSAWSPLLAGVSLLLGLFVYRRINRGDRSSILDWEEVRRESLQVAGRQPHRFGHLLSIRAVMLGMAMSGIVGVFLAVTVLGLDEFTQLGLDRQAEVTGYLVLLSSGGVLVMLGELLSSGPQVLRRLAVMPKWSRMRLFAHAELSCWRIGLGLLLALLAVLLATGIWTGMPMWELWLAGLTTYGIVALLGIYVGLWLACMAGSAARVFSLMIIFLPLALIAAGFIFTNEKQAEARSTWSGPVALATALALAWWLRRQARSAWTSISFNRED